MDYQRIVTDFASGIAFVCDQENAATQKACTTVSEAAARQKSPTVTPSSSERADA